MPTESRKAYNLERFAVQQERSYESARREILAGRKTGHWMWYIFPQLQGLGRSEISYVFGIEGMGEAAAYLADPVLGGRLREISECLLSQKERDPDMIFGFPDTLKLRSCMTLFEAACGEEGSVFSRVLEAFYDGQRDPLTLSLLEREKKKNAGADRNE